MEVTDIKITGTRGKTQGQIYTPHRQNDGTYVVSKTRFAKDYYNVLGSSWICMKTTLEKTGFSDGQRSVEASV